MNYQEFKDHLITFLWKKGDAQLIASLDNLIRMGEAKLTRELRTERRHTSVTIIATDQREQLPADYHSMRQVVDLDGNLGEFKYVTPGELEAKRDQINSSHWLPIYSLEDNFILLCGPTEGGRKTTGPTPPANPQEGDLWARTTVSPGLYVWVVDVDSSQWVQLTSELAASSQSSSTKNLVIHYTRKIPDFQATDTSWLADEQLDLLTYATLYNTAAFLREDERIQTWQVLYQEALQSEIEDSEFYRKRGVPDQMKLPRQAGVYRPRRV